MQATPCRHRASFPFSAAVRSQLVARRVAAACIALGALAALTRPAAANWPTSPASSVVVSPSAVSARGLAPSGVGGVIVGFQLQVAGPRVQRFDSFGNPLWAPGGVRVTDQPDASLLSLLPDGAGGAWAAFHDPFGNTFQRVQRLADDGRRLLGANGVVLTTVQGGFIEALAPAPADGVWAAWTESRPAAGRVYPAILARRLAGNGSTLSSAVACDTIWGGGSPLLVPDGSGGLFLFWLDNRADQNSPGAAEGNVYGQHLDANGVRQWPIEGRLLAPRTIVPRRLLRATTDGQGGAYVLYDLPGGFGARLQRLDGSGAPMWGDDGLGLDVYANRMSMASAGPRVFLGGIAGGGLRVQSVSDAGLKSPVFEHPGEFVLHDGLDACADQSGGAVFVWSGKAYSPGGQAELWADRFGPDGSPMWPGRTVRVARHPVTNIPLDPGGVTADDYGGIVYASLRGVGPSGWGLQLNRTSLAGIHGDDGPTAVLTSLSDVRIERDRVELQWFVGEEAARTASVERRVAEGGWSTLGTVRAEGPDRIVFEDRNVSAGDRHAYRLAIRGASGILEYSAEVAVEIPGTARAGLLALDPNPMQRLVVVRFALSRAGEASVDVLDAAGRRVARLARGVHAAGEHATTWNGLGARGDRVPPGLYLVRWRGEGREETRRLVRVMP